MKKFYDALVSASFDLAKKNYEAAETTINSALRGLSKFEQFLADTLAVTSEPEPVDRDSRLLAGVEIGGCNFHVDMIQTDDGISASNSQHQNTVEWLDAMTDNANYATVKYDGLDYIVFVHPGEA